MAWQEGVAPRQGIPDAGSRLGQEASPLRTGAACALVSATIVALAFTLYWRAWGSLAGFVAAIDPKGSLLFSDYLLHYLPTGSDLWQTGRPAPGFFYSAFFALLFHPLAKLGLEPALWVWGGFQLLVAALLAAIPGRRFWRDGPRFYYFYLAALAFSVPLLHNVKWGQVSTLVTLGVVLACLGQAAGRPALAAVSLAGATAIKYYPGAFAIYFLLRRRERPLAAFAGWVLVLLVAIPGIALGPRRALGFQQAAAEQARTAGATWVRSDENSQYVASVLPRLLPGLADRGAWSALGWAVCAFNLAVAQRSGRLGREQEVRSSFSLLLCSTPFFVATSWPHYFVYLPFCQTVACLDGEASEPVGTRRARIALAFASAALASAPLLLGIGWRPYARGGALFFANVLCLVALHLRAWPRGRSAGPGREPQ